MNHEGYTPGFNNLGISVKIRWLNALLVVLFSFNSRGQEPNVNFVFGSSDNFEIRIDQEKIYNTKNIYLTSGTHIVEIWNPGLELITDTISVNEWTENVFRYSAATSDKRESFKTALKQYKIEKRNRLLPWVLPAIVCGAGAAYFYTDGYFRYQELTDLKNIHDNNLASSLTNQQFIIDYNRKKDVYRRTRLLYYSFLGISTLSAAVTIFQNQRYKKKYPKPIDPSMQSPFTNKTYELSLHFNPGMVGLKFVF